VEDNTTAEDPCSTDEMTDASVFAAAYARSVFETKFALDKFVLAIKRRDLALLEVAAGDIAQAWPLAMSGLDAVAAYLSRVRRIIGKLIARALAEADRGSSLDAALRVLGSQLEITQESVELSHALWAAMDDEHERDQTEVNDRMNAPSGKASWKVSSETSKRKAGLNPHGEGASDDE
jgi:hypothetical protein